MNENPNDLGGFNAQNNSGFSSNGGYNNGMNFSPYNSFFDQQRYFRKKEDRKILFRLSLYSGGALLLSILLQNVMFLVLEFAGYTDLYFNNPIFECAFSIILTIIGMYLPFAFMGKQMQKISGTSNPVPLGKPQGTFNTFLAVVAGLGVCMAANYVTSFITVFMSLFGLEPESPEIGMPTGPLGIILNVARIAVVAAVVEELSLRGFVMGNLRRYGDSFAIIMSAFVFAFMHGNLIQTPFALVAGFGLGYFSVKTNSLWTGILIHAINNLISLVITYCTDILPEEALNLLSFVLIYGLIGLGGICLVIFTGRTKHIRMNSNETALSIGERVVSFLFSPTMIAAMIYMLYVTITYISQSGA